MGQFAKEASQYDSASRGKGLCVAGEWISEHMDDEDLAEFVRLSNDHRWSLIVRLSGHGLKYDSLRTHAHGACQCVSGTVGRGCCSCAKTIMSDDQKAS